VERTAAFLTGCAALPAAAPCRKQGTTSTAVLSLRDASKAKTGAFVSDHMGVDVVSGMQPSIVLQV